MRTFPDAKLIGTLIVLMLAFSLHVQGSPVALLSHQAALTNVGHGPSLPPDPDEPPAVLGHGPSLPPDPDEPPAVLGHGPSLPPDPDEPPAFGTRPELAARSR